MDNYYIYIYLDPRKPGRYDYNDVCLLYEPFYVGKGKDNRYKETYHRINKDFIDVTDKIKNIGLKSVIIKLFENLNEQESLKKEKELILNIGRINLGTGTLINKTSGGQGTSGFKHTNETKYKMKKNHPDFGGINNPHFAKYHSEESKNKISESMKGINHPFFGKHFSEEHRKRMSEKRKGDKNGNNSLITQDVFQIKLLLKNGKLSLQKIANIFGVGKSTISRIKNGRNWSHIKI